MVKRKFAILLPILMLIFAILLDAAGDSQRNKLVQANVGRYGYREDLPAQFALARYMGYGINAPAWLISIKTPFIVSSQANVSCCGFIKNEKDLEYLIFLVLMWHLIGRLLDRRNVYPDASRRSTSSVWRARLIRGVCGLYGAYLIYSVVLFYQPPWNYPRWFLVPVALWGAAMIAASIYPISPARMKYWYRLLGLFIVLAGVFYTEAGMQLYRYRSSFGVGSVAMFFVWGIFAMIAGSYLVKNSTRPLTPTA